VAHLNYTDTLFLIYINDLVESCGYCCDVYVFADDAKFYQHVKHPKDQELLQLAINALHQWSKKWLLSLNTNKCHVVSYVSVYHYGQK